MRTDRTNFNRRYNIEELKAFIKESQCWSDVCRKAKVSICTFNFKRMQALCTENNISYSHFDIKKTFRRGKHHWTKEELFVSNSTAARSTVREFVKKHNVIKQQCSECRLEDTWNGKPLRLELDHINGDCTDNRLDNLRFLCPNCHSQTPTFKKGCLVL